MAYKDSVVTSTVSNGSTGDFTVDLPTYAAGDRVVIHISYDNQASTLDTVPSGWDQLANEAPSAPDGHHAYVYEKKSMTGSEGTSLAWSMTANSVPLIAIAVSVDGRSTGAATFVTPASNTTGNATPISVSSASGTAAAGDDILAFISYDATVGADTWATGTWSSSLTEAEDSANANWCSAAFAYRDGVSAGAFGTITATGTRTAGSGTAGYTTIIVALPSGGRTATLAATLEALVLAASGTLTGTPSDIKSHRVILSALTDASGIVQDTAFNFSVDTDVIGRVRKASGSPLYSAAALSGTITVDGLDLSVFMDQDE